MRRFSFFWPVALLAAFVTMPAVAQETETSHGELSVVKYRAQPLEPYPDFVLPNIETGKPVRLSDFRGQKVLIVNFASW